MDKQNLSRIEADKYIGVSPSWLDKDFSKGKFSTFPCIKLGGRRIYQRDQLDRVMEMLSFGGRK